ncbi:MAG: tripartite tricarboxylate transporter TctB family protein [Spirochaetota bacterium]|nr:tripartite tricarboxylate transporter TctB family protein [Spirochaetota bacterium]
MKKPNIKDYYSAERVFGIIFIMLGIAGLYDTIYGEWRSGPGYGTTFFPQLTFVLLIIVGFIFQFYFRENKTKIIDLMDLKTIVLLIGSGAVFFQMVRHLGLITSSFLYCSFLIAVLTSNPAKNIRRIVVPGLIGTIIIWLLFTKLVVLILPRPLLF